MQLTEAGTLRIAERGIVRRLLADVRCYGASIALTVSRVFGS